MISVSGCSKYGRRGDASTGSLLEAYPLVPHREHDCPDILLNCDEEFVASCFSGCLESSKLPPVMLWSTQRQLLIFLWNRIPTPYFLLEEHYASFII